jgi:hypothetical protein
MTCGSGIMALVFLAILGVMVERKAIRGCCSHWRTYEHES